MLRLRLEGATLIDGTGRTPLERATLSIESERIVGVGKPVAIEGYRAADLSGLFLLPGLIDAHTHFGTAAPATAFIHEGAFSAADLAVGIFRNCELALLAGFTSCRELGGVDGGVARLTDRGSMRIPAQSDQPFRPNPISRSGAIRSPIPGFPITVSEGGRSSELN